MDCVTVQAPSSKSVSHRALIAAALAHGSSAVVRPLLSRDLIRTRECLEACGAAFREDGERLLVEGMENGPRGGAHDPADLDVEESGTTCRLMTAVAACGRGAFRIHGAPRMHERPMGDLTRALASQGVAFQWGANVGYAPFVLDTRGLSGGELSISLEESSQYLSGLLLASPLARSAMDISVTGEKAVSWPYVSLTLQVMEEAGVPVTVLTREEGGEWRETDYRTVTGVVPGRIRFLCEPGRYRPRVHEVEGDWSNASYFLAAGAIGKRPVTVIGLRRDSLQGDKAILDILQRMGAEVSWDEKGVTVSAEELHGIEVDMGHCPDLVPTVAAAACFAKGPTLISNVAHLRIKESDRLAAPAGEIAKAGARAHVLDDGIRIIPGPLLSGKEILFSTHNDHRMAMSLALFELAGVRAEYDDPSCVSKSFPDFWNRWRTITSGEAG